MRGKRGVILRGKRVYGGEEKKEKELNVPVGQGEGHPLAPPEGGCIVQRREVGREKKVLKKDRQKGHTSLSTGTRGIRPFQEGGSIK